MRELISKLRDRQDLEPQDFEVAALALTSDDFPDEAKAEFLSALSAKGESPSEIAGMAGAFLRRAVDPGIDPAQFDGPLVDLCGTGGDRLGLFNISTAACFIVAAAGGFVVKHGNRGISSKSGGADVLEELGVPIDLPPDRAAACLHAAGMVFLFAPKYHPAFKAVAGVRRALAERGMVTIFNILGPLLNPARPPFQLCGLFRPELVGPMAEVLGLLGRERALVVSGSHGNGLGMDEVSPCGTTRSALLEGGTVALADIEPSLFGVDPVAVEGLKGGSATENARTLLDLLGGSLRGPIRVAVEINAAAALRVCGLAPDYRAGIELAREQIDSGRALAKLAALKGFA